MLMVLGHACYSTYMEVWVNMFDIPCFFFMSGYCFKDKYLSDFKTFTFNRIRGIYWPFVKWTIFFILLHNILYDLGVYNSEYCFNGLASVRYSSIDVLEKVKNAILRFSCDERLLGGYWFLPCLFIGSFIFYASVKISNIFKTRTNLILCFECVSLLIISTIFNGFGISKWVFDYKVLEAGVFILSGYLFKISKITFHNKSWFLLSSLTFVILGSIFWQGAAVGMLWQNQIPYTLTAICGSIATLGLCQRMEGISAGGISFLLNIIGENTLTILTWHFTFFLIVSCIITQTYGLPELNIGEFPVIVEYSKKGWCIAYFVVAMLGSLLFVRINKHIKNNWLKL